MGGSRPIVFFGGAGALEKERFLSAMSLAWRSDLLAWAEGAKAPQEPSALFHALAAAVSHGSFEAPADSAWVCEGVARLFGSGLREALLAMRLGVGLPAGSEGEMLSGAPAGVAADGGSRRSAVAQAAARRARSKASGQPRLGRPLGGSSRLAGASAAKFEESARELVSRFGFAWVSFDGSMGEEAGALLASAAIDCMGFLASWLGLEERWMGLGGWGLEFKAGPAGPKGDAGICSPRDRIVSLDAGRGCQALAHEWFHAFDAFWAASEGSQALFASESASPEWAALLGAAANDDELWAPSPGGSKAQAKARWAEGMAKSRGYCPKMDASAREAVSMAALAAARSPSGLDEKASGIASMELSSGASRASWSQKALSDLSFKLAVLESCQRQIGGRLSKVSKAPSAFAVECCLFDALGAKLDGRGAYLALGCEMLARAFEACASDAAAERFGMGAGDFAMVSDARADCGSCAPRGADAERCRIAFAKIFEQARPLFEKSFSK